MKRRAGQGFGDPVPQDQPETADEATGRAKLDSTVEYCVAANDCIVSVGETWDAVARAYGACGICGDAVVGRHLFGFISGDVTRMYISAMLDSVRTLGVGMRRGYRCDVPGVRRFMEMELVPQGGGEVVLQHRVLQQVAVPQRYRFSASIGGGSERLTRRCSVCNRVRAGDCWVEPEHGLSKQAADSESIPTIYDVCQQCAAALDLKARR